MQLVIVCQDNMRSASYHVFLWSLFLLMEYNTKCTTVDQIYVSLREIYVVVLHTW